MRVCLIPVKPLDRAKQRLADVLDPVQRRALQLAMLSDVIDAAAAVLPVWVITSDADAASVAQDRGVTVVADPCPLDGLNASLDAVTAIAVEQGAEGTLVLAADCPATTPDDVRRLTLGPGVAIAPDRRGRGTNALWRMPPAAIPAVFGPGSKNGHASLAHIGRVPHAIIALERVGLDVDEPADLAAIGALQPGAATRTLLAKLGYPAGRR